MTRPNIVPSTRVASLLLLVLSALAIAACGERRTFFIPDDLHKGVEVVPFTGSIAPGDTLVLVMSVEQQKTLARVDFNAMDVNGNEIPSSDIFVNDTVEFDVGDESIYEVVYQVQPTIPSAGGKYIALLLTFKQDGEPPTAFGAYIEK